MSFHRAGIARNGLRGKSAVEQTLKSSSTHLPSPSPSFGASGSEVGGEQAGETPATEGRGSGTLPSSPGASAYPLAIMVARHGRSSATAEGETQGARESQQVPGQASPDGSEPGGSGRPGGIIGGRCLDGASMAPAGRPQPAGRRLASRPNAVKIKRKRRGQVMGKSWAMGGLQRRRQPPRFAEGSAVPGAAGGRLRRRPAPIRNETLSAFTLAGRAGLVLRPSAQPQHSAGQQGQRRAFCRVLPGPPAR